MKLTDIIEEQLLASDLLFYFETEGGSKYIMDKKGRSLRWKSHHANTGGEDMGLKEWYNHIIFVPEQYKDVALAYEKLKDKGFENISLTKTTNNKDIWIIADKNQWRVAKWKDAYPKYCEINPEKKDIILGFESIKTPTIGHMVCEYNTDRNGIRKFHPGSMVVLIKNIEDIDENTLKLFNITT